MAQKTTASKPEATVQTSSLADDMFPPPPPPAPPTPPPPPAPPKKPGKVMFTPPVIVNEKGYDLSVHYNNGNNVIYAKKKGVTEKISMDKWNAKASFYENKYGKLPPPPPPPPAPPVPPVAEQ